MSALKDFECAWYTYTGYMASLGIHWPGGQKLNVKVTWLRKRRMHVVVVLLLPAWDCTSY